MDCMMIDWLRPWKRRLLIVLGVLVVLAAAVGVIGSNSGTGDGSAQGTEDTNGPGSFVGRASNAVMFVQWTRAGSSVTGSLREAIEKARAGSGLTSTDHALTGVIHGNGITLNLRDTSEDASYVGEVRGEDFNLTLPGKGNSLITVEFAPGEVAEYDADTKQLLLSEYPTPCSLYVAGNDVRVTFTGANAAENCAEFVAKKAKTEWITEAQAEAQGQPVACELTNRANEQAAITDEGGQYYGGEACRQLSGEGWG